MEEIKLHRTAEDDILWIKRMAYLTAKWKEQHKGQQFKHLFQDMGFLSLNGVKIEQFTHVDVLTVDFPYVDTKKHLCLIPHHTLQQFEFTRIANVANTLLKRHKPDMYALVKKNQFSIDYPHYHLLIY